MIKSSLLLLQPTILFYVFQKFGTKGPQCNENFAPAGRIAAPKTSLCFVEIGRKPVCAEAILFYWFFTLQSDPNLRGNWLIICIYLSEVTSHKTVGVPQLMSVQCNAWPNNIQSHQNQAPAKFVFSLLNEKSFIFITVLFQILGGIWSHQQAKQPPWKCVSGTLVKFTLKPCCLGNSKV